MRRCRNRTIDPIVDRQPARQRAADDRLALDRSGRFGGRVGHQIPWRRRLQRHPRTGRARRHGAHACARKWRPRAQERLRAICAGLAAAYGATITCRLRRQLSGHRQPSGRNRLRQRRRRRDRRRPQCPPRHPAGDGRRGFLLHAGGAARRLHLHRQWRHARTSTIRPTTSTTRSSRTASATGCGWPKRRWPPDRRRQIGRHETVGEATRKRYECARVVP